MDATTIIVMGMILNHSCVSFKFIILTILQMIFYNNLNMHNTFANLIRLNL